MRFFQRARFGTFVSMLSLSLALVACSSTDADEDGGGGGGGGGPEVADTALNGLHFKLDGAEYAVGNAAVYRFSPTNQRQLTTTYRGSKKFHGTTLNYASVTVSNTLPADSVQVCGALNTNAALRFEFGSTSDDWGGAYNATACSIKLDYMSQTGGIEGTIVSATLKNDAGKTIEIADGKFRVYHYSGWPGVAAEVTPTNAFFATLQIDSGSFELASGQHFRLAKEIPGGDQLIIGTGTVDGNTQLDGNSSDAITLRVGNLAGAPGAFTCGATAAGTNLQVWLGTYLSEMKYVSYGAGASCTLNVVGQPSGARQGTYTATLVAADNILSVAKRSIKVRGSF